MGKRFLWREKWSGELLAERFPERAVEGGCGFAGGWCEGCWPGGATPCVLQWSQRKRTGRWCNCLGRSRRFILCCARCGCCRSMDGHGDARMRRCELGLSPFSQGRVKAPADSCSRQIEVTTQFSPKQVF